MLAILIGKRSSFVPLHGAAADGDRLAVAWDKATVKNAPQVDDDADGYHESWLDQSSQAGQGSRKLARIIAPDMRQDYLHIPCPLADSDAVGRERREKARKKRENRR